jgi:D-glycero-alpha-D-manno-heptose-7-phosphate kinase
VNYQKLLEDRKIRSSVPCRIDFGGTLDLATFYLPLNRIKPSTVNLAVDLRTTVTLSAWTPGRIRISSRGFESAEFDADEAPFNHPMGLMFACAAYFNAQGVHIKIDSASPPRSALGGSSAAAVAIIAAFYAALGRPVDQASIAMAAHSLESSVAGVVCGAQDQLAAAFGGVNQWYWQLDQNFDQNLDRNGPSFVRKDLLLNFDKDELDRHLLVAYCGNPHESKDINQRWVQDFLAGRNRKLWIEIARLTEEFAVAIIKKNYALAGRLMNQETQLRLEMTPDVLDKTGIKLFERAATNSCGARFTGAGGGGCIWAMGEGKDLANLKTDWLGIIDKDPGADMLNAKVDPIGINIS